MDERELAAMRRDQRLAGRDRGRVAVERDDVRTGFQGLPRYSRRRRKYRQGCILPGVGASAVEHLGEKNRNVANRSAIGISMNLRQDSPPFRSLVLLGAPARQPALPSCRRLSSLKGLRLPKLKMVRPTDEGHLVGDPGEVANEIRDHQPPFGIELHEDPAPMNQERHLVRAPAKTDPPPQSDARIDRADPDRRR